MCFSYLLFGHLLGDFTLQFNIIADNKAKSWKWNLIHAVMVTICMLIFSVPFGLTVVLLVLLNGAAHYFIDFYKSKISTRYVLPGLAYFIFDQAIHILLIYLIAIFAVEDKNLLFLNAEVIKMLIVAVFVSSFSGVLVQFVLFIFFPGTVKKFFERSEKEVGNLTRLFITFGIFFSHYLFQLITIFLLAVFIIMFFQFYRKWYQWMNKRYFVLKLLMDIIMSMIGIEILIRF